MNREQRMSTAIAKAMAEGVDRAQRAPALAEQREQMNGFLRGSLTGPNRAHADASKPPAARDEGGRFTGGQGLDQGSRGGGASGSQRQPDMNERLRGRLATRKDEE